MGVVECNVFLWYALKPFVLVLGLLKQCITVWVTTEIDCLTVLEVGVHEQGVVSRGGSSQPTVRENLCHSCLQAFGGLLTIFGVPWLVEVSSPSLSLSSQALSLCVCVSLYPNFLFL